jgi:methylated-DNA-protein-cysteine methyltransferase-like protein
MPRFTRGKISSYGRIAVLAGLAGQARLVGYALHALRTSAADGPEVPWWRVVNAAGAISNAYEPTLQRALLEDEGVTFDARDGIDLARYLWDGSEGGGGTGDPDAADGGV